uniref:Uncharacterized protein n=1 Tax=Mycena chlorophos TaxID=658473 RepID=A0ABQ0L873_MYCCL|nr:predicted protein [Mycena chlorophos]
MHSRPGKSVPRRVHRLASLEAKKGLAVQVTRPLLLTKIFCLSGRLLRISRYRTDTGSHFEYSIAPARRGTI